MLHISPAHLFEVAGAKREGLKWFRKKSMIVHVVQSAEGHFPSRDLHQEEAQRLLLRDVTTYLGNDRSQPNTFEGFRSYYFTINTVTYK